MGRSLLVLVLCAVWSLAIRASEDGLCNFEATSNPGLPKAMCFFPSCPSGGDCIPPVIDKTSAKIEYYEPLLQWKDVCPNTLFSGSCWEVYVDFKFRISATDPAGVGFVGVNVLQEVDTRKENKKYWARADKKDPSGKYELSGGLIAHVPPGRHLELSVHELCAKDSLNNEGCVPPGTKAPPTTLSLGMR